MSISQTTRIVYDTLYDEIMKNHTNLIVTEDNKRGPGAHLFRYLKHTKKVDGKETNCEYDHIPYDGKGWTLLLEKLQASTPQNINTINKYINTPEKYLFVIVCIAQDESASFPNFCFRLFDKPSTA